MSKFAIFLLSLWVVLVGILEVTAGENHKKEALVFSDDFEREVLGETWTSHPHLEDLMEAWIDGELVASLRSEGIAHKTKTQFGFTVTGQTLEYDNVKAWRVRPKK